MCGAILCVFLDSKYGKKESSFKAMGEKAEEGLTELYDCSNGMARLQRVLKIDSKEADRGGCMGESENR